MTPEAGRNSFKRKHPWASRFLYIWAGFAILLYPVARFAGFDEPMWSGYYFFTFIGGFAAVIVLALVVDVLRRRSDEGSGPTD